MKNDGRISLNGRCQKDALDRAEDICELCGNQYCASCLLFPRGHRNPPTCKTCALQNSGIRGSSTKISPMSKREYKKLKKQLIEQLDDVEDQEPAIEYFELQDPSRFDQSTELDRRPAVVEEDPTIDILATHEPHIPAPPTPTPAPPPPPVEPPIAAKVEAVEDHAISGLAPVDTSINPLALGGSPEPANTTPPVAEESDASASAAELLARLKADQPIQSQFAPAPSELDTDPFARTTSDLVAPPPAIDHAIPAAPSPSPSPQPPPADKFARSPRLAPLETQASTEPAAQVSASGSWSPPAPPPRGSNLAETPDTDAPPTTSGNPEPVSTLTSPFDAPLKTVDPRHAQETPTADDHPARRKADTDQTGAWIPPSLRGMAAEEDRGPLPKRRS